MSQRMRFLGAMFCLVFSAAPARVGWTEQASAAEPGPSAVLTPAPSDGRPWQPPNGALAGSPSPKAADARTVSPAPTVAVQEAVEVRGKSGSPAEDPLPLRPPHRPVQPGEKSAKTSNGGQTLTTVVGSLGLVLAVFFLFVWMTRRAAPRGQSLLPPEVVESLGRAPLAGRQQMVLIRVGRKLVLLSVTSGEARTLTEVTDPEEVDRLAGICQQGRPGSVTATFRQVLAHCTTEPLSPGAAAADRRSVSTHRGRAEANLGALETLRE